MKKLLLLVLVVVIGIPALLFGWILVDRELNPTTFETIGEYSQAPIPPERRRDAALRQQAARSALGVADGRQILFGDLHVHTTFSIDAFTWSLPSMHGTGLHPPADACDYARFCSQLDFWSTNDHSEGLTPRHWEMIRDNVNQCNALSGDPADPEMVTFLGWEWTQMGNTPEAHYGHRVVVMKDEERERTPARPIMSGGLAVSAMRKDSIPPLQKLTAPYLGMPFNAENRQMLRNLYAKQDYLRAQELCSNDVPSPDLPQNCMEYADTPGDLQRKLREWGFPALVIPHGTTWGYYTPPGTKWDKQLSRDMHDPALQGLIEVFSGHGNSEEYRDWRAVDFAADGSMSCPEPTGDYTPCCHRAGEIIQSRCEDPSSTECAARVATAEINYLQAGRGGRLTVPDVAPEEWLNCGQCTDCYMPAFNFRPGNSVQYIMQLANHAEQDANGDPLRFRFGFIGSSDNHLAQPGVGYKELDRHLNTDTSGLATKFLNDQLHRVAEPQTDPRHSVALDLENTPFNFLQVNESERQSAFFMTGGLVAVHSPARDRDTIFSALQQKEVYGTSGPRILLWFDLLQPDGTTLPMGSGLKTGAAPRFRVRAAGSYVQKPGCPQESIDALGAERLEHMCGGECYNPGDARIPIERIEVVRIRPRLNDSEPAGRLIEDPWKVIPCDTGADGCSVEFSDPEYATAGRDTLYYVRALQVPTPTVNGKPLQCVKEDANGRCAEVKICWGDQRTELDDDCLEDVSERAWSSPIFLDYARVSAAPPTD